ncbi:hypothetical protein B0A52_00038 [Exophiala mesophila]|uniref:Uncharacterized protein n=1 Tax=Exophiala mesophila TaxID=212818 RepID=A0A438NIZ7_EXOME|nr:hypothetical protein B0A52_00038 [Exophiala mesophila]
MRRTHEYTASQYVTDSGFPLSWMCRCLCTGRADEGREQEAEEYHQRNKPAPNVIIGRPAGRNAYHGQSAMRYPRPNETNTEARNTTVQEVTEESSQPSTDANANTKPDPNPNSKSNTTT